MTTDEIKRLLEKRWWAKDQMPAHSVIRTALTELLRYREGQEECEHIMLDESYVETYMGFTSRERRKLTAQDIGWIFCALCGKDLRGENEIPEEMD